MTMKEPGFCINGPAQPEYRGLMEGWPTEDPIGGKGG